MSLEELQGQEKELQALACCSWVVVPGLGGKFNQATKSSTVKDMISIPAACIFNGFVSALCPFGGYPIACSMPKRVHDTPIHRIPGVAFPDVRSLFTFLEVYYKTRIGGDEIDAWPIWKYNKALYGSKAKPYDTTEFFNKLRDNRANGGENTANLYYHVSELTISRAKAFVYTQELMDTDPNFKQNGFPESIIPVDHQIWLEKRLCDKEARRKEKDALDNAVEAVAAKYANTNSVMDEGEEMEVEQEEMDDSD